MPVTRRKLAIASTPRPRVAPPTSIVRRQPAIQPAPSQSPEPNRASGTSPTTPRRAAAPTPRFQEIALAPRIASVYLLSFARCGGDVEHYIGESVDVWNRFHHHVDVLETAVEQLRKAHAAVAA